MGIFSGFIFPQVKSCDFSPHRANLERTCNTWRLWKKKACNRRRYAFYYLGFCSTDICGLPRLFYSRYSHQLRSSRAVLMLPFTNGIRFTSHPPDAFNSVSGKAASCSGAIHHRSTLQQTCSIKQICLCQPTKILYLQTI